MREGGVRRTEGPEIAAKVWIAIPFILVLRIFTVLASPSVLLFPMKEEVVGTIIVATMIASMTKFAANTVAGRNADLDMNAADDMINPALKQRPCQFQFRQHRKTGESR